MKASYTLQRRASGAVHSYRGAIRIERETVVWECPDEHGVREEAKACAGREIDRRTARPPGAGQPCAEDRP